MVSVMIEGITKGRKYISPDDEDGLERDLSR